MFSRIFTLQKPTLQQALAEKTSLNALILLYNVVQMLNTTMNQIFQSAQNFKNFEIKLSVFCRTA